MQKVKFPVDDLALAYELHNSGHSWRSVADHLNYPELCLQEAVDFTVTHGISGQFYGVIFIPQSFFTYERVGQWVRRPFVSGIDVIDNCGPSAYMGEF